MEQEGRKGSSMEQNTESWAVTMRFGKGHNKSEQENMVKGFMRNIMNDEHIALAYAGVYITNPPHAHFIVYGSGKQGQRLRQLDKSKWKRRWADRSGLNMYALDLQDISDEERQRGWKGYLQKNVRNDEQCRQVFYNYKMLERIGEA